MSSGAACLPIQRCEFYVHKNGLNALQYKAVNEGNHVGVKQQLTLGRFIEEARKEAGLSIRQLAELSGILKTIVGRMILDQVQQPKPDHLMRLAQVLEVRAADMFLLAGIPVPKEQPSVEALLRSEYELPETAVREAKRQIDAIVERYAKQQATNPRKEGPYGIK